MNGKQLKNSILQWAIQGKLVPQDPNDEPASVLLERIREEKARLVKEGKIKKDKNESIIFRGDDNSHYEKFLATGEVKCIDDEIPFEIPEGWEWCRLGFLSEIIGGYAFESSSLKASSGERVIRISDINETGFVNNKIVRYNGTPIPETYRIKKLDILMAMTGGTVGKSLYVKTLPEDSLLLNQRVAIIRNRFIDSDYLDLVIKSPHVKDVINSRKNSTNDNISMTDIYNFLIPIPAVQHQVVIVKVFSDILPLINRYGVAQFELDRLNTNIKATIQKSVLHEAIQGKLVPQDPNDEPASVLLERIREEKQRLLKEGKLKKKDITDSIIFKGEDNKYFEKIGKEIICIDDDIPFDIPISWEWVRLGNLFQHNTGKALNGSNQKGTLYEYITTSNLYWNQFVLDKLRQMPFTDEELEKCTVRKGDLLICEGGDIGRCAIWNYDYDIRIQNHIHRLRAYTHVCTSFFYYTMYLYKHIGLIGGKGIGIQGLSSNALHKLLLPLPPMNEQQRIVNKIELAIASIMSR